MAPSLYPAAQRFIRIKRMKQVIKDIAIIGSYRVAHECSVSCQCIKSVFDLKLCALELTLTKPSPLRVENNRT